MEGKQLPSETTPTEMEFTMHETFKVTRNGRWFRVSSFGTEFPTSFPPAEVVECARHWRCSRVFWNGRRAEPELGAPCGRLNGAPYNRQAEPAKPAPKDATEAALFLAGIAIGRALK